MKKKNNTCGLIRLKRQQQTTNIVANILNTTSNTATVYCPR